MVSHPEHLEIIQIGDPILRKTARELSREEILKPEIQQLIEDMKACLKISHGNGLAAPQIGHSIQLAIIEDMNLCHLTDDQLKEQDRSPVPFHAIINPRLYVEEGLKVEFFESCLSVPGLMAIVPRAKSVRIECFNDRAEPVVVRASGWYARILQHEIDHLNGITFIERALMPSITTKKNYSKYWKSIPNASQNRNYGKKAF